MPNGKALNVTFGASTNSSLPQLSALTVLLSYRTRSSVATLLIVLNVEDLLPLKAPPRRVKQASSDMDVSQKPCSPNSQVLFNSLCCCQAWRAGSETV